MRAIQGHSGGTKVDPALLDNVEVLHRWSEYLYHVGCSRFLHSMFPSGLIAGDGNTLLPTSCRDFEHEIARRWSNNEWLDLLQQGGDKKRFQYCRNLDSLFTWVPSKITLEEPKLIQHCWTTF